MCFRFEFAFVSHMKSQRIGEISSAYPVTVGDSVRISDYVKGVGDVLIS